MSRIGIYVEATNLRAEPRTAQWHGDLDWPGAPRPGDTWFHCGDWAGETIHRTAFNGPGNDEAGFVIEVRTTTDVIRHLIDDHGFAT